jgi:hypothetical protein
MHLHIAWIRVHPSRRHHQHIRYLQDGILQYSAKKYVATVQLYLAAEYSAAKGSSYFTLPFSVELTNWLVQTKIVQFQNNDKHFIQALQYFVGD